MDGTEANIVPETPVLTERLISSKQFSLTVQRDNSTEQFCTKDGHNLSIKNKEESALSDIIYSGSSQISRDKEAKEFLAKLKNQSDKERNGSRKRKRDCVSFKSSPAKKRAFKSFGRKGSNSLQCQSKTTSSKESSFLEQEEGEEAPKFLSCPENHSRHPSPVLISILETKLLPSSSCTGELQANTICSVFAPKEKELTSNNDLCFSDASLQNQLSLMDLRSRLNDSTHNSITQGDITMKDRDQTFYTPDASDRVSLMMSPPVLSPDYSLTPMNFSPDFPESSELPVGTPVIKTFSPKSPKRIELGASPESPTSPEFPKISVEETRFPKGKVSFFTAKVLDESPNSPSVPLSNNLQLSKSHTNRPTSAKALSFVRSEDRKIISSLVHSSGEDSESSDHSPTLGCYMSNSNSSTKTIINKAKTYGKRVESNKDELEKSRVNFKIRLFERLRASRYGISSEVESDYNNDCSTLDRNVDTQSNSDDDDDGDMIKDETKVDDIFCDGYDFVYEDGGYNCDNELESADLSNVDTGLVNPNCCVNIDTPKRLQKAECREITTPVSSKNNKGNPVKGSISYFSDKKLSAVNAVKQPVHELGKGAQKPKRQYGKGANRDPNTKPITPMADYDCMNTPELKV